MGEDAEGAAENISKLRDQMLSLTGVDIQLDNSTYKSTYQILLEISKVWSRLDDLSRASVLEQLFGKRQANIGAAILENGELLEQVYKKSEGSMGSAMREQEEYAKSIQYSIDTLKAAYQDFADTVINSKFIKSLLGTAQSFLEVLTKIIDKFGVLPTIIASLSAPAISQIFNSFKEIKQIANYDFGKLYKIYEINLNNFKGFSAQEIQSLQKYVDLLKDGAVSTKEFNNIFADSRKEVTDAAKGFEKLNKSLHYGVISQEEYDQATQDLALSQKTATATSKALSLALKAIASVAIMVAINLAIKGISTLVDKLVVTKEELNEIREVSIENIQELSKSIDELVSKEEKVANLLKRYQEIVSSTDDLSKSKDELLTIQNNIVEQFGAEKNSLDLLNDSYDVAIEKVKKLSDEEYARWKRNNAAKISELNDINSLDVKFTGKVVAGDEITSLDLDASNPNRYSSRLNELYESYYVIKDVDKEITEISKTVKGIGVAYSGWLKDSLSLSGDIREAYDQLGNLIDAVEASGSGASVEALSKRYDELGNVIQEIDLYMQKQTEHELAYNNLVSNTSIDNLKLILTTMGDLRSKWFDNLKDMQEESENTVGKISDALQSMVDGEALSSKDFWGLMELDTKHILTDIQMVGDKFVLNQEQLIALKDQYIDKQVESIELQNEEIEKQKEQLINAIAQAKAELAILGAKGLAKEASDAQKFIQQAERALLELENQQRRNNALIDQTNSKLGDTANYLNKLKKELDELNNELDDYVSAFEYRIDRNINGLQAELDVLNEQKDAMQAELDVLNEQKDAIQETIDNYKTVADLVQDVVEKRKEELEAEKKAIEDTYNERINKLKEETEQREDAFEYAQKLANLENAKNNKRRVYDEARGWRYESVKEDVVKAENDLAKFENEREIKSLEKERDELTKTIDEQIKEQTEYAQFYKDTIDEIIIKEKELVAEQILGSNWREEIANLDMTTAEKFRTEYNSHNTALQNITRTEIKLKEAAIKAKDAEIKSKEEQIKAWQKYKTDVQNAVKEVKTAQEGYMAVVRELDEKEPLTLDNRGTAFETFKTRVTNAIDTITSKQSEIDNLTSSLDGLGGDYGFNFQFEGLDTLEKATYLAERLAIATSIANKSISAGDISNFISRNMSNMSPEDMEYYQRLWARLSTGNFASGGVVDYTGMAMVHGTKQRSETMFNANDSAKLYDMVHNTPSLIADMLTQANKLAGFKIARNENTNNNSINVNIGAIYANNPNELTTNLDTHLDRYFKTKLTQSYTSRQ